MTGAEFRHKIDHIHKGFYSEQSKLFNSWLQILGLLYGRVRQRLFASFFTVLYADTMNTKFQIILLKTMPIICESECFTLIDWSISVTYIACTNGIDHSGQYYSYTTNLNISFCPMKLRSHSHAMQPNFNFWGKVVISPSDSLLGIHTLPVNKYVKYADCLLHK